MSSAAVIVVAWLSLAVVVLLALAVVLLARRVEALARANTDRRWEVALLRAEVAALHRRLTGTGASPSVDPRPDGVEETDVDPDEADAADRAALRRTASPPAWRRDRGRAHSGRPRRRRPA